MEESGAGLDPPHLLQHARDRRCDPGGGVRARRAPRPWCAGSSRQQRRRPAHRRRRRSLRDRGPRRAVEGELGARAARASPAWTGRRSRTSSSTARPATAGRKTSSDHGSQRPEQPEPHAHRRRSASATRASTPTGSSRCSSASTPRARARSGLLTTPVADADHRPEARRRRRCPARRTSSARTPTPTISPDGRSMVFRRLRALGNGGLGAWDVMTVRTDGTGADHVRVGPGLPRRARLGAATASSSRRRSPTAAREIVIVDPDGSNRRAIADRGRTVDIGSPRWLPSSAQPSLAARRTCPRGRRRSCRPPRRRPR